MGFEIIEAEFTDPAFFRLSPDVRGAIIARMFRAPLIAEFRQQARRRGERVLWRAVLVLVALSVGLDLVRRDLPFPSTAYALSVLGFTVLWAVVDRWLWVRWMRRESQRRMGVLLQEELVRAGATGTSDHSRVIPNPTEE